MGKFVLRVRDRDLYVEWSTVVDNAINAGDRTEMLAHLTDGIPAGYAPLPGNSPEDRLARADETGTSMRSGDGAWDSNLMVGQNGTLRRADLGRFVDALLADDTATAYALLTPFEDEPYEP